MLPPYWAAPAGSAAGTEVGVGKGVLVGRCPCTAGIAVAVGEGACPPAAGASVGAGAGAEVAVGAGAEVAVGSGSAVADEPQAATSSASSAKDARVSSVLKGSIRCQGIVSLRQNRDAESRGRAKNHPAGRRV